jgi:hypothetical protein
MKWLATGICVATLFVTNATAQTTKTTVRRDACDPTTFNAVVGPETCLHGHLPDPGNNCSLGREESGDSEQFQRGWTDSIPSRLEIVQ